MAIEKEIKLPRLGDTVVEGVIGAWLKKEGERVELDEPLVEVDTDKVNTEIPSPFAGVLHRVVAREGETVPVGGVLCVMLVEEGASEPAAPEEEPGPNGKAASGGAPQAPVSIRTESDGRHAYSPAVRRLAEEHGIDPAEVPGTGEGGRVTRKDMEKAALAKKEAEELQQHGAEALSAAFGDELMPVSRSRRTLAERMVRSVRTVPHAWTTVEVDVTNLVRWRESVKESFRRKEGVNLTYLPFVIKAAVEALKEYPIMNSMWDEENIVIKRHINIGVAVDLDSDLVVVPVIKDADQLSIAGIAKAVAHLAAKARAGELTPDDVQGGTFTVNNTGAFGSILSAPIINYPQAAIMSMETITRRPVVVGDGIAIRSMMNLCCSIDHRILDGAVCGRFLRSVKTRLESYREGMPLY